MKRSLAAIMVFIWFSGGLFAQEKAPAGAGTQELLPAMGRVSLPGGIGILNLAGGYAWLDPTQTKELFETKWGNQNFDPGWGAILPPDFSPDGEGALWLALVRWHPSGRVGDAGSLKAGEVLEELKKVAAARNVKRKADKLPEVDLKGWALEPRYDGVHHTLAWAVEWTIGNDSAYDFHIAFLGKAGWLDLQIMVSNTEIGNAKAGVDQLLSMVSFAPGQGFDDFGPSDSPAKLPAKTLFWNLETASDAFPLLILVGLGVVFAGALTAVVFIFKRRKR